MKFFKSLSVSVLILLFSQCTFKSVNTGTIKDVKFQGIQNKSIQLSLALPIENPNMLAFKLHEIHVEVTANNYNFGTVNKISKIKIPGNSDSTYTITLKIETPGFFSNALNLLRIQRADKLDIHFKGWLSVRSLLMKKRVSLDKSITIPGINRKN